jgi:hypothetical protein
MSGVSSVRANNENEVLYPSQCLQLFTAFAYGGKLRNTQVTVTLCVRSVSPSNELNNKAILRMLRRDIFQIRRFAKCMFSYYRPVCALNTYIFKFKQTDSVRLT